MTSSRHRCRHAPSHARYVSVASLDSPAWTLTPLNGLARQGGGHDDSLTPPRAYDETPPPLVRHGSVASTASSASSIHSALSATRGMFSAQQLAGMASAMGPASAPAPAPAASSRPPVTSSSGLRAAHIPVIASPQQDLPATERRGPTVITSLPLIVPQAAAPPTVPLARSGLLAKRAYSSSRVPSSHLLLLFAVVNHGTRPVQQPVRTVGDHGSVGGRSVPVSSRAFS